MTDTSITNYHHDISNYVNARYNHSYITHYIVGAVFISQLNISLISELIIYHYHYCLVLLNKHVYTIASMYTVKSSVYVLFLHILVSKNGGAYLKRIFALKI